MTTEIKISECHGLTVELWQDNDLVIVDTKEKAEAIIESLQRMIKAHFPEENDIPVSPV